MNKWAAMLAEREATKVCGKCGERRDRTQFHRNKHRHDGLQSWCKVCYKTISKDYYWEHKK